MTVGNCKDGCVAFCSNGPMWEFYAEEKGRLLSVHGNANDEKRKTLGSPVSGEFGAWESKAESI